MRLKPFVFAVLYFIVVIFVAHFFAPAGYCWTKNTISDLASQGHAYKWIMQAGFIGFGALLRSGVVGYLKGNPKLYFLFPVAVYGLSIFLSGVFCTTPLDPTLPYSVQEAALHSLFATIAGMGLSLGILLQVFVSRTIWTRWIRIIFLLLVSGISGLFGLVENNVLDLELGIIQRMLYLTGLAWLVYEEQILPLNQEFSDERK